MNYLITKASSLSILMKMKMMKNEIIWIFVIFKGSLSLETNLKSLKYRFTDDLVSFLKL